MNEVKVLCDGKTMRVDNIKKAMEINKNIISRIIKSFKSKKEQKK